MKLFTLILFSILMSSCIFKSPEISKEKFIVLLGDSMTAELSDEHRGRGWGQFLKDRLTEDILVQNLAKGGATTFSCIDEFFDEGINYNAGYYLIQFGHNNLWQGNELERYKSDLIYMITTIKNSGSIPILITPAQLIEFDNNGNLIQDLYPYKEAVIEISREENIDLIDLYSITSNMYYQLGEEFCNKRISHDKIHFLPEGAELVSSIIAEELKKLRPELDKYIK